MEDFTAKLKDIQETKFPIVKAAFKGKDDQTFIGVMYIHPIYPIFHSIFIVENFAVQNNNKV